MDMYRWHDLRKSPEDIPNTGMRVLLCCIYESCTQIKVHRSYVSGCFYGNEAIRDDEDYLENREKHHVIAWRYIEPFDEE